MSESDVSFCLLVRFVVGHVKIGEIEHRCFVSDLPDNCQRDGHEREIINTAMQSFRNILVCSHSH